MARKVFLLSPANCAGKRAGFLLRDQARFDLAVRLRATGAGIGEVFSFMSGLYFRGKIAYAAAFASAPEGCLGAYVIVPGQGLLSPGHVVDLAALRAIAKVPVDVDEPRYTQPLLRDIGLLHRRLGPDDTVVLLGSLATSKYLQPLGSVIRSRLRYPREFVGRGDMSRGSLMLRCAEEGRELEYAGFAPDVIPPGPRDTAEKESPAAGSVPSGTRRKRLARSTR